MKPVFKGVQVLVVDNDRDTRDLYAFLLKDLSANVITADSVKEALEILSWFTPNIIVSEIRFLGESIYTLDISKNQLRPLSKPLPVGVSLPLGKRREA